MAAVAIMEDGAAMSGMVQPFPPPPGGEGGGGGAPRPHTADNE